jgi:hypothetical protein
MDGTVAAFDERVERLATGNPLSLAIGAIAAGFFIGLSLPLSNVERERLGRVGDRIAHRARSAAGETIEQGQSAVVHAIREVVFGTAQRQA